MSQTLKNKTINALAWNLIDKFGQQILFFATGIFLARLLDSRDFGLLGMISIFTVISGILIDSGFGLALIKKNSPSQADYNSVFYFNLFISIFLYLILYISAPFIAKFYNEPQLNDLCRVTFLAIVFNALALIQNIQLLREINFKVSTVVNIVALILAGAISIFMAYEGYGVWALVVQTVSISLFKCLFLWISSKWKPTLEFSIISIKEMLPFGLRTVAGSLINGIYNNIYPLLIGRFFSVSDVGYYFQANKFQSIPVNLIDSTFRGVSLSIISSINDDIMRMKRVLSKSIRTIAFLIFPIMGVLIVCAKPIILILLTDKWIFSVEYLQILSLAGISMPFISVFNDLCNINHRSDLFLKLEIFKKVLLTILIICAIPFGIKAMVWAWVAYGVLSTIISVKIAGKLIDYGVKDFILDVLPPLLLTLIIVITDFALLLLFKNLWIKLILGGAYFLLGYIIIALIIKLELAMELKQTIFSFVQKRA